MHNDFFSAPSHLILLQITNLHDDHQSFCFIWFLLWTFTALSRIKKLALVWVTNVVLSKRYVA